MAAHVCKECSCKFEYNKRGRPPTLCEKCRGAPTTVPIVKDEDVVAQSPEKKADLPIPTGKYELLVGNLGVAYRGDDEAVAMETYASYVKKSYCGFGQVGYEKVTLLVDGEVVKETDPRKEIQNG